MHTRRVHKLQEFVAHSSRVNCVHISRNTGALVAAGTLIADYRQKF
jgi:hypothetical protein